MEIVEGSQLCKDMLIYFKWYLFPYKVIANGDRGEQPIMRGYADEFPCESRDSIGADQSGSTQISQRLLLLLLLLLFVPRFL